MYWYMPSVSCRSTPGWDDAQSLSSMASLTAAANALFSESKSSADLELDPFASLFMVLIRRGFVWG